ncbi:hypothetical protein IP91_01510 [Pseudoduganella lurida]|uniref:Lipoprotein n=1 Tax=Pseudoduganella lurida TaxID=1036180 RepID=A0A562RE88_9BURK|nr:hypothetical protein [Pseudoduganella lurida]TWI67397.1 hypothetical protein IP91_01510 [Pseudoduganella lurida]
MKHLHSATTLALAMSVALAGCAAPERSANGHTVRAVMASQIVPPQPHEPGGTEAGPAVAGYANYQRSYESPTPQNGSAMVGSGFGK